MNWYDYIGYCFASFMMVFMSLLCYFKIANTGKISFDKKTFIILIVSSILLTVNTYANLGYSRALISYLIVLSSTYLITDDSLNYVLIRVTIYYLLLFVFEIIYSLILSGFGLLKPGLLDNYIIIKSLFSSLIVLSIYLFILIPFVKKIIIKITNILDRPFINNLFFVLCILVVAGNSYKAINEFSTEQYLDSLFLLCFLALLVYLILSNKYKVIKEVKKTEELLNTITVYEKRIDEDRILRHEMLNNLLALKSFDEKNSEEFNKTLDEFIMSCSNKSVGIKNIYKLPTGLKGMVYYKINSLDNKKYNYNVNISKQVNIKLEKENYKEYISLCKILGIILDNAIEACEKTKDKFLTIDVYNEKDNVVIDVENSYKDKIFDINLIYKKNYSSKGNNRGLGLYVAKMLLKNSKYLEMNQEIINNIFVTKIYIKQKI